MGHQQPLKARTEARVLAVGLLVGLVGHQQPLKARTEARVLAVGLLVGMVLLFAMGVLAAAVLLLVLGWGVLLGSVLAAVLLVPVEPTPFGNAD